MRAIQPSALISHGGMHCFPEAIGLVWWDLGPIGAPYAGSATSTCCVGRHPRRNSRAASTPGSRQFKRDLGL
jgi:hypothetical protein